MEERGDRVEGFEDKMCMKHGNFGKLILHGV